MKHLTNVTRSLPAKATSPVEVAGMFAKLQTMSTAVTAMFGGLTAGVNFYNLIANPPFEIVNGQKGIGETPEG